MVQVLLLTAAFGDGHRQVAAALTQAFEARGAEVHEVDCMRKAHPMVARINEWLYEWITRYTPWLYGTSYRWTRHLKYRHPLWRWLSRPSRHITQRAIAELQPRIAIQLFSDHALSDVTLTSDKLHAAVVLTDFTIHARWFHDRVDTYFLPHARLSDRARRYATERSQLVVSGIPVRQQFDVDIGLPEQRARSARADIPYVLFASGGRGLFPNLEQALRWTKEALPQHDVYVMCGRNRDMKRQVERLGASLDGVFALSYTEQVAPWLQHATCAVVKAGGVTMAECLAAACPPVMYRPLSGQEAENAQFIQSIGAGLIADGPETFKSALRRAVGAEGAQMQRACAEAACAQSADEIAEYLMRCV